MSARRPRLHRMLIRRAAWSSWNAGTLFVEGSWARRRHGVKVGEMTLKSLSTKLYLGIALVALVMWMFGVSGRTILSLAAVGFKVAMHASGHGGHGPRPRGGCH